MNKSDLIAETCKLVGNDMSKAAVERVLNSLLAAIKNGIKKHQMVQLVGFGTFAVVSRAKRTGVNPRTKEKITIPAKKVVKFKPGADLSRTVE